MEGQAVAIAHDYLEKFVSEYSHYLTSRFISEALDLLRNVRPQFTVSNIGMQLMYIRIICR